MKRLMLVWTVLIVALGVAAPASAKSYSAERFDSAIRVLPGGTLDVTETVVFRFEDGTFTEVFRDIPLRRTDGIEVVRAELQGERLPFGREPGTVEVARRGGKIRVLWRFSATQGTTRQFVLNYLVRGVVRQEGGVDLLAWRATPGEHRYRIDSSTIRFELPAAPAVSPVINSSRVSNPTITLDGNVARVHGESIRENGWIDVGIRFTRGTVATQLPAWQQHAADISARSIGWIVAGAVVFAAGIVLLVAVRQSYDRPPDVREIEGAEWRQSSAPDLLTPPISGVLASNGRPALEHAMATLFTLADRGHIAIEEKTRSMFSLRDFTVSRKTASGALTGYERTLLDIIFAKNATSVTLSQARSRLMRGMRTFGAALTRELTSAGLLDESRKATRDRYNRIALGLLIAAALSGISTAALIETYGPWPLLVGGAALLLALIAVVFAASITPLSNEGVRRGAQLRQYRKHLRAVAQDKQPSTVSPASVLPYAIALGLAGVWSKYMKAHQYSAPSWFRALPSIHDSGAFAAFVATGGAGASSGHGVAGGGAAGGGASGAG